MKLFKIATKDFLHFLRSPLAWVMMFVAPMIIPTIIYMAFGNMSSGGFDLPVAQAIVVDQDRPDPQSGWSASQLLVEYLQGPESAKLISLSTASDEDGARLAIQQLKADVAVIIPENFTAAALDPAVKAEVTLVNEPVLTIAPEIVKSLVYGFIDGLSGAKIAVGVASQQADERGIKLNEATAFQIAERYISWVQATSHSHSEKPKTSFIELKSPSGSSIDSRPAAMIGPVMAGMIIFFVFFTGANSASMIIQEDEDGTLARLYTTPTSLKTILGGKLVSVVVTLVIQVLILLFASRFIFNIQWGAPLTVLPVIVGLVSAASGFGLFLMSFIRTSQQAGIVQGGVMTLMGMLGGLFTAFINETPSAMNIIALFTPQGWAMRSMKLALAGARPLEVLVPVAILLALGFVFYLASIFTFRKRFA